MHISMTFEPTRVISRCGTCFWAGWSCKVQQTKCEKCEKKAKCTHYVESSKVGVHFRTAQREDMVIYQDNHTLYLLH